MVKYKLVTKGRTTQVVEAKNKAALMKQLTPLSRKAVRSGCIKIVRI